MNATLTLLSASGKPAPLVDLDGTLLIQLGLFLLLWAVLKKLVFDPYLAVRRERAEEIEGARRQAEHLAAEHQAQQARYEEKMALAQKDAAGDRARRRSEGEGAGQALLVEARQRAEVRVVAARAKIEQSAPAAELALRTRADHLARAIALKILGRPV